MTPLPGWSVGAEIMTANPGTFEFIEQRVREAPLATDRGKQFEWLCRFFLLNAPKYRGMFTSVWLWDDWPGRWGVDKGIDLVAATRDGHLWAIQAKAISPDRSIPKSEVDSFLSESNRPEFAYRLIIATTNDIGHHAWHTLESQEKPVGVALRSDLLQAALRWPEQIGDTSAPLPAKQPRPHQLAAISDVIKGFGQCDRGQLIMASGTGKTLTALWIAEALESSLALVLVPSLSLISQTLSEWRRNACCPFDYLVVCSDDSVAHGGADAPVHRTGELGIPVTTDPARIREFLTWDSDRPSVVFCTYQSSDRLAEAQKNARAVFDLVIADEAHRCTGPASGVFATVLDAAKIKARKRLFLTATPRYFTGHVKALAEEADLEVASMDDVATFGPRFHELSFGRAIREDLLTDYQVVIIGVTREEAKQWAEAGRLVQTPEGVVTDARTIAAQIGLAKAMVKYDLRRVITFHSSVAKAREFGDPAGATSFPGTIRRLSEPAQPSGTVWTAAVYGEMPAGRRLTFLDRLRGVSNDERGSGRFWGF